MSRAGWHGVFASLALVGSLAPPVSANELYAQPQRQSQLVFGSYSEEANAHHQAAAVSRLIALPLAVIEKDAAETSPPLYRVVGPRAPAATLADWSARASELGVPTWRLLASTGPVTAVPTTAAIGITIEPSRDPDEERLEALQDRALQAGSEVSEDQSGEPPEQFESDFRESTAVIDFDLGLQNRLFANRGINNSDRAQQSASAQFSWAREFSGGRNLVAFEAFARLDSDDSHRTHADLRELSVTHIADRWQLQAGVGQVFWGVVEFNHLIDIVNQTDLVEDPDGEAKLGQPMVTFTALPDWGSVELFILPGFRERTLPGISGRLTTAVPIDRSAAEFESGAGKSRVDGLLRISTQLGGVLFDAYHFNGTRRTPRFEVRSLSGTFETDLFLVPSYDTIKQTAVQAQVNTGDTAIKLEALQQDGGPESYWAAALGLEHTFVGAFRGASDLGIVIEYHYDSRGPVAFDSFFESDLAIGARFAANDLYDSQALLGVVWDTSSQETVVVLEASRRLNDRWSLGLESRWFAGGSALGRAATVGELFDTNNKLGSVQRDDYIQLEFTRFF